jgi:hypothetical protein
VARLAECAQIISPDPKVVKLKQPTESVAIRQCSYRPR